MPACARCSSRFPTLTLALAARAFQIVDWDATHRFCGRCGTRDARQARRAREGMPGLRPRRLSARVAGDDGARDARPRDAARARAPLSAGDVQRARGIRRARRDDRGLHPPRGARGGRRRRRRARVLREPVVGVSALADDRVHRRVRRRRTYARTIPRSPRRAGSRSMRVPKLPPSLSIARRLIDATVARLAGGGRCPFLLECASATAPTAAARRLFPPHRCSATVLLLFCVARPAVRAVTVRRRTAAT